MSACKHAGTATTMEQRAITRAVHVPTWTRLSVCISGTGRGRRRSTKSFGFMEKRSGLKRSPLMALVVMQASAVSHGATTVSPMLC